MINLVLTRFPQGPLAPKSDQGFLYRINEAYRTYSKFKALSGERLTDMGLNKSDQASARFGGFWERAYRL
ncbi:MAG: hypothetical protein AAGA12_00480 [Pseudomonadota bacterium]